MPSPFKSSRNLSKMALTNNKNLNFLSGQVMNSGIAIGRALVYDKGEDSYPRYWICEPEVEREIARFQKAIEECRRNIIQIKGKICKIQGHEPISILESHMILLQDELMVRSTTDLIRGMHINAEWALHKIIHEIARSFSKINQAYIKDRGLDIAYVEEAIQSRLQGKSLGLNVNVPRGAIVVAKDLSPAEIVQLVRQKISGLVLEGGSIHSHTAIVVKAFHVPAVFHVSGCLQSIATGDFLVVDGTLAQVLINPSPGAVKKYKTRQGHELKDDVATLKQAQIAVATADGQKVMVLANMELIDEIDWIRDHGADGVGLYRTEFLYLQNPLLTFDDQRKNYRDILKKMPFKEVTIRTFDLGADKVSGHYPRDENPALGLRAIRLGLKDREFLYDQLKALLMASTQGRLKICIPMISSIDEFRTVKKIVADLTAELTAQGIRVSKIVKLGAMIETPSAAMEVDLLCQEADFLSLGTNDLIQYLLAVDRSNDLVSHLYSPLHPSVIRTLFRISQQAQRFGVEVTVCGEMAGHPATMLLLLGLGFNRLSMMPATIPKIKKMIRGVTLSKAQEMVAKILQSGSLKESQKILQTYVKQVFPLDFSKIEIY